MDKPRYFIITVDAEADNLWAKENTITIHNIDYIPRFQELCNKYDFYPTYLTSYELLGSDNYASIIKSYVDKGLSEIGAHLHPWNNPPYEPKYDGYHDFHAYPHDLPLELFRKKMETLTSKLENSFQTKMTSYRAGRWGFSAEHARVLLELGYIVDCSVTPFVSWEHFSGRPAGVGGMDFYGVPSKAYVLDKKNVNMSEQGGLVEVPMTIVPLFGGFLSSYMAHNASNPLVRIAKALGFGPQWFRPLPYVSSSRMISVGEKWLQLGNDYVEMMIHSSELMPGGSPYYKNKNDIESLYAKMEETFNYFSNKGLTGIALTDYARKSV